MQIREPHRINRTVSRTVSKKNYSRYIILFIFLLIVFVGWKMHGTTSAIANFNEVKSGWSGYCLDDYHDKLIPGSSVDIWSCNKSEAQNFELTLTSIRHDSLCLSANSPSSIDLESCNSTSPNQVWLRDQSGYYNPNLRLCLSAQNSQSGQKLSLNNCSNLANPSDQWYSSFDYTNYSCNGSQGQVVACNAIKQWMIWNDHPYNHESLLVGYTGGAPYEEWCADFVSYIFKISNYPFSNGNYDGWDENNANDIYSQGFVVHSAKGSYLPQPGDVGYFSYYGGHVEIVIVGGKEPTFIYGDSATIDPTTGNGQMEANTILSVKNLGQIKYYYSPTSKT
ncbi:MAG: ricin-type beta-trefoil lectin domain protein [Patescibacteria group bacterium]|nr:ricin-type beta-trefoil lectin domain protein [Patescibacteria group bacterium]